jgi:hypothetical protein
VIVAVRHRLQNFDQWISPRSPSGWIGFHPNRDGERTDFAAGAVCVLVAPRKRSGLDVAGVLDALHANFFLSLAGLSDIVSDLHPEKGVHFHPESLLDAQGHFS